MNYDDFIMYIKENLADCYRDVMVSEVLDREMKTGALDGDNIKERRTEEENQYKKCEVIVQKVVKNNGILLDAVSIYQEGERISPNIYLKPFYDSYMMGKPLDFIMTEIIFQYRNEKAETDFDYIDLSDYTKIRDNIILRLINYDRNREMLSGCPHIKYLDLAITFRYIVDETGIGMASILITNKEFEMWGIEVTMLYHQALFNSMHQYPWSMEPISKYVWECFDDRLKEKLPDDVVEELNCINNTEFGVNMYILSNQNKAFGASSILYDNVLKNFANVQGTSIYVLPSSVHEVMLVPDNEDTDPVFLKGLLEEGNRTSVGLIDLLSDEIYYFDNKTDNLTIYNL